MNDIRKKIIDWGQRTRITLVWRSLLDKYPVYLLIPFVVFVFFVVVSLCWFCLSMLFGIFLRMANIHPIVAFSFLLILLGLVWFGSYLFDNVKKSLPSSSSSSGVTEAKVSFSSKLSSTNRPEHESHYPGTVDNLPTLPLPHMGMSDLFQPGHRHLLHLMVEASDEQQHKKTLGQLQHLEESGGYTSELELSKASTLLHMGKTEQALTMLKDIQQKEPGGRAAKDAALLILAAKIEFNVQSGCAHPPALPVEPSQSESQKQREPSKSVVTETKKSSLFDLEKKELQATPIKEHPATPSLGGIPLAEATQFEQMLEEADRLRKAGEYQKGHILLKKIMEEAPDSRYAKDAKMRILGDSLMG